MSKPPNPERLRQEYADTINGIKAAPGKPTCVFLVKTTDLNQVGDDLAPAASMARQLARLGYGVRFLGPGGWYAHQPDATVVVATHPDCDPRRVRGAVTLIGWVQNRVGTWLRRPGLLAFDAIITPTSLTRAAFQRTGHPVVEMCAASFDADLFNPCPPGRRTRRSSARKPFLDRSETYSRSSVTIAEVSDNAASYGLVSQRILEALACGSLAITNHANGLEEAGLRDLPVFHSTAERDRLVAKAVAGELSDTANSLRRAVADRHTVQERVSDFAAILERARLAQPTQWLDFYPDYSSGNPFQGLLYSALDLAQARAVPVDDVVTNPLCRDSGARLDGRVLHLHWLDRVVQETARLDQARERLDRFRETITELKARGARVVWTVHNTLPHQLRHYFLELELCQFVADHADAIHVMSGATSEATAPYYKLPQHKVVKVGHPSYDGAYPVVLDRAAARKQLDLADDDIGFLFFGLIREYKGVGRLLDAFDQVRHQDVRLRLDVVGRVDPPHTEAFVARLKTTSRVRAHLGFLPDHLIQRHLLAADVMVLPYERGLNSGTLALATTFGLPVVVPNTPAFAEVAGRPMAETFEAGDTGSLAEALLRARSTLRAEASRDDARDYAEQHRPSTISHRLLDEVLQLR